MWTFSRVIALSTMDGKTAIYLNLDQRGLANVDNNSIIPSIY